MKCPQCGSDVQENKKCGTCGVYVFGDDNGFPGPQVDTPEAPASVQPAGLDSNSGIISLQDASGNLNPAVGSGGDRTLQPSQDQDPPQDVQALDGQEKPVRKQLSFKERISLLVLFFLVCGAVVILYMQGYFALIIPAKGEIFSPKENSATATKVSVTGVTSMVIRGHYIWLAVDKKKYRQCWPKAPVSEPNKQFSEDIWEGGPPEEPYTLSLYAVDKRVNDRWLAWLAAKNYNGLPMPAKKHRLDSVALVKEK